MCCNRADENTLSITKHPHSMVDAHWLLFLLASVVVIATPGQDMILVMSKSLSHGVSAGVATAAGVSVGLVGHTLLATLGLGALLRTSEWLFTALKFVGAAYLLYIGGQLLLTRAAHLQAAAALPQSNMRLFLTGAASNISNPKIAVFYFAFLPQFIAPGAAHPTLTIFVLGVLFAALTFLIKGPVAVFSGRLSTWFQSRPAALVWLYRCSGLVMVGLALRLALSRRSDA
jgi:threonine/homoserine/homoserine lactone efflux protein